ncbi:MAG: hypothetical protein ACXVEF_20565 [Polyangiales bacterium]
MSKKSLEPLSQGPCIHVGIDENGLGPVLGPLLVTGVAFRFAGARPDSLGALVGDSKALVSHDDPSLGEAWARAILSTLGPEPKNPHEIVARISMDADDVLRSVCPPATDSSAREHHPASMCWPETPEAFVADEAMVRRCMDLVRGWKGEQIGGRFVRKRPLELVGIRASIVCASRLNAAAAEGRHRFMVDLHEMERIALRLHEEAGGAEPLDAICGKVGGMASYGDYFGQLSNRLYAVEYEQRRLSAYRFPGLGRFAFLQDADASDPLVGLASLVGKYLRELLMGRIVRWMSAAALPEHLGKQGIPADASGYRDPNTKRFIAASELVRAHRGVPDRCFER